MTTAKTANVPRILCVDDEPAVREVLALQLRRQGYAVETAPDGLRAWELINQQARPFDLVITDNQMPHLTGVDLVERLRSIGFAGGIVFFSSTLPSSSAAKLARLRVALVEKGRPVEELMTAIEHAIKSSAP